jgi:hypothetical protein
MMDEKKLKELNNLKKQIDELDKFLRFGNSIRIKLFGKVIKFKRANTFNQAEYDIPKELYADVMDVLWKHLIKLQKQFDNTID